MASSVLSVRLPEEIKEGLTTLSDLCDRTDSYIATIAISEFVDKNGWKIKELKKASLEADKGNFISNDSMENWVNSLGTKNEFDTPEINIFHNDKLLGR